jgi:asparagine synthetase B (glutamine-hydrolysing)
MCGIAGKFILNRPITEQDLLNTVAIRDSLIHRGPDDFGITYHR